MKLERGKIYDGWKYVGFYRLRALCDKCQRNRQWIHEFVHPDTQIGNDWDGYRYADEPWLLGTECVKSLLSGKLEKGD